MPEADGHVVLGDLVQLDGRVGRQRGRGVAVDHALLERGVELGVVHRSGVGAVGLHQGDLDGGAGGADLQPLDVGRDFHRLAPRLQVGAADLGVVGVARDQQHLDAQVLFELGHRLLPGRMVLQHVDVGPVVLEQEREVELEEGVREGEPGWTWRYSRCPRCRP